MSVFIDCYDSAVYMNSNNTPQAYVLLDMLKTGGLLLPKRHM